MSLRQANGREPHQDPSVLRMLHSVLMPGFHGTAESLPDWLHRAIEAGLGGVCYFAPNLTAGTAPLSAALHAAHPRLLIASDEEGGVVTRLDAATGSPYPGNAALGQIDEPATTEHLAHSIGTDLRAAGIDINLAPSLDINVNPHNPVIGVRAFGADTATVSRHGVAFVTGLQAAGVAATAKHFPGHGDTHTDSHHALPVIDRTPAQLVERELVPFAAAVSAGCRLVMPGHIRIPALGTAPTSINPQAYTLLRSELGFDGATVTDALDMHALTQHFGTSDQTAAQNIAQAAVAALRAGADLLCLGNCATQSPGWDATLFHTTTAALRAALANGEIPVSRLATAAERVAELADWTEHTRAATPQLPTSEPERTRLGGSIAEQALRTRGMAARATNAERVTLVDVRRPSSPAAARRQPWLAAALRNLGTEVLDPEAGPDHSPGTATSTLLVLTDDPTTTAASEALATHVAADPVLVVTGWPRPEDTEHPRVVWTLGDSRAAAEAVARLLCPETEPT